MTIDPQFLQRRLLAASGFAELSLFQEAVQELEELPESSKELPPVLVVWLEVYQQLAEMVRSRIRRHAVIGNGTRRTGLADRSGLCDPTRRGLVFANEVLLQAGEKFPNCGIIQFNLACYAAQLGQLDEARQRLRRAVQLDQEFASMAKTDADLEPIR